MRHEDIWRAIDTLAAERGLSTSGLARAAGLDPTSFNPSKRRARTGSPRWPSTESIAKILAATGVPLDAFADLIAGARALPRQARPRAHAQHHRPHASAGSAGQPARIPLIGFAQAGMAGFFDDGGYPTGAGWEQIDLPHTADPNAYALRIAGDSMEPVYRHGDIVIVAPHQTARIGDRVIARLRSGEAMAKLLAKRSPRQIELASFNPAHESRLVPAADVLALHRIIWASQ